MPINLRLFKKVKSGEIHVNTRLFDDASFSR